jgi:hypothetical protein
MALVSDIIVEKFQDILVNDVPCNITDDTSNFRIPSFALVPHYETLCLLLIALAYGDPEETSYEHFLQSIKSVRGYSAVAMIVMTEPLTHFLRYLLKKPKRVTLAELLQLPEVLRLSDRSEKLFDSIVDFGPLGGRFQSREPIIDQEALNKIIRTEFPSHELQSTSIFVLEGIPFCQEILRPIPRVVKSVFQRRVRASVFTKMCPDEGPEIVPSWFICSRDGRMSLVLVCSDKLIEIADGSQKTFQVLADECEFFAGGDRRLYLIGYDFSVLRSGLLAVDPNQPRTFRKQTDNSVAAALRALVLDSDDFVTYVCDALSFPSVFAKGCGFNDHVAVVLSVLVNAGPGADGYAETYRASQCHDEPSETFRQQLADAEQAWAYFTTFCVFFVEFLDYFDKPTPDGLIVLLTHIFALLPVRMPRLLTGVVRVFAQFVALLDRVEGMRNPKDHLVEFMCVAIDMKCLERMNICGWNSRQAVAWARGNPNAKFAQPPAGDLATTRKVCRQLRSFTRHLAKPLPKRDGDTVSATPMYMQYWQSIRPFARIKL